jgi:hypothetical protein
VPHRCVRDQRSLHGIGRRPVSRLSAAIPRAASRRTMAPCPATSLSRAEVVLSKAAEDLVSWRGWHGMQGVRGSNPLSSTPGQRPNPAPTGPGSPAPGSRSAAAVRGQVLMSLLVRADVSVAGQARITRGHHLRSRRA